jgi:ATPase subunit of ABC transporter with duplicated ATPase domains
VEDISLSIWRIEPEQHRISLHPHQAIGRFMSTQKFLLLRAENLAYQATAERSLFQNIHLSIEQGDRIALVGANGIGKSTLLKILANQLQPHQGSVQQAGAVYYLPQISTLQHPVQPPTVLDFLNDSAEEWWQITELLETRFQTTLDLSRSIVGLSGGELTRLSLAIGLAHSPDLLLLDEPTNHLDYAALEVLRQFLQTFEGAFVIVSHKPFFLDQVVQTTWELTPTGLEVYGGNFSHYRLQKEAQRAAAIRAHEVARKTLKRVQSAAMQEQQRSARSRKNGRQKFLQGSVDRMAAGLIKTRAETSTGLAKRKHEAAVESALQKVAETHVKTHKTTQIQLEERSQKRRNLVEIEESHLWVGDRELIHGIQLRIGSGDRIAIAGANGSGKSSLVQAILDLPQPPISQSPVSQPPVLQSPALRGKVQLAPSLKVLYLDQTYALIQRQQTILDNMRSANPDLDYQLIRQQLGHFLFFNDEVHKLAGVLSGGELARLAIAMLSISDVDLLILDEPTNNLDIETVRQIVQALNEYEGALWVISHDLDFLSRIEITHSFQVTQNRLQQTTYLPGQPELYYQELLHSSEKTEA